jgi:hypothetical protein
VKIVKVWKAVEVLEVHVPGDPAPRTFEKVDGMWLTERAAEVQRGRWELLNGVYVPSHRLLGLQMGKVYGRSPLESFWPPVFRQEILGVPVEKPDSELSRAAHIFGRRVADGNAGRAEPVRFETQYGSIPVIADPTMKPDTWKLVQATEPERIAQRKYMERSGKVDPTHH